MDALDTVSIATELSLGTRGEGKADEATALRSFEAYFLGEMLRISAPSDSSGLFDGGQAGRMYREHFYQELARIVAENGGVGIATSLAGQLDSKKVEPAVDERAQAPEAAPLEREENIR